MPRFISEPIKGTDPRNRVGRRTAMPMSSGASWNEVRDYQERGGHIGSDIGGRSPCRSRIWAVSSHRHTTASVSGVLASGLAWRSQNSKLVRRVCSRRDCDVRKHEAKKKATDLSVFRRLRSLVVERAGSVGASGARGHFSALACRVLWRDRPTSGEKERRSSCLSSQFFL